VALGALTLAMVGAPSCTPLPVGETMLILQTDLSLPKDIDKLTIDVLVRGEVRNTSSLTDVGADGSLLIPASLGIILDLAKGTDASTPVTVRATAFQKEKARIIREVVTTVPRDRIAALKMPIQWLCWDQVALDEKGQAHTSCPDMNQTCVAGTCVNKEVDPSTLGDFSPDEVFGGGTGTNGDGTCFDTSTCFTGSVDAPAAVVGNDCVIKTSGEVNVAIRVDSAGICGASGCFVPIDAKSEFGWQPGDAGTIKLPRAVCDRISISHTANGVSIAGTSATCPLKTNSIPACGPWSASGKAPPDPATLGPVQLVGNQASAVSLALGGGNVFWTNAGTAGDKNSAVKFIPIAGGSTSTVAENASFPKDLALDLDGTGAVKSVIWADTGTSAVLGFDFTKAIPLAFPIPNAKAPTGVALVGTNLFVTDFTANAVYRIDTKTKSVNVLATTVSGQSSPNRIAADATTAFWTNEGDNAGTNGSIVLCDLTDPAPVPIASLQNLPRNLALDLDASGAAKTVYWANYAMNGDVMQISVGGKPTAAIGMPTSFAKGQGVPYGITLDATNVYWTNHGTGTVMKAPKAGGAPIVVAKGQNAPGAIVVDANNIYWINEGAPAAKQSAIMKISKSAPAP
jgi:streptogramin lyase